MKKINQKGFTVIEVALVVVVLAVIGFVVLKVMSTKKPQDTTSTASSTSTPSTEASNVSWSFDGSTWKASGTPPTCPSPALASPVNLAGVTSILYPGQTRGGDYKAHGGFRFADGANTQTVKVPIDSVVTKGSRYIEQGETQYFFVFIAPCGIMYRFDHLLTLSPEFQKIADTLPAAKPDDSRTTNLNPPVSVKKGDIVATAIGFKKTGNAGVDFGVYDLRKSNGISKGNPEFNSFAVCWFDWLPASDAAKVKALPAGDGASGKASDLCKG